MKKYKYPVEMLQALCRAGLECMTDMPGSSSNRHESYKSVVAAILSLVIAIVVI